ncbi:nucleotidyltransferase domain-containing protein [Rhizobium leguminosarum]|uniref:nucleotidyltransferase domain-containing protein n=1 Tax=Rhizobium leguminosarum TaxID=384 RepID=UPI00103B7FB4|nr:nucleotidyltransferase [Rhizobium leguminosarum]TCA26266.1 nucleotidyltransferase [Rhizobium leguminosarum bv. viciae]
MNYTDPILREIAAFSPLDVLLADIAVRIQLTPTDHRLAVSHYHAIHQWLEREDSPLSGLIVSFYAQGGFSIGATTARHAEDADFDIDAMIQVSLHPETDPEHVLSTLHTAIRGEPGSRYYGKTERKSRCVTVKYDGMHLDVTPAVLIPSLEERTSFIFHSKKAATGFDKAWLVANPWGFAEWFLRRTPPEAAFGQFFERQSLDYERLRLPKAESEADPVPNQDPAYRKSRAVIALQLIKRWRNLAYDARHGALRLPPSVVLAHSVALNANRTSSLSEEVLHQVVCLISALETAERNGASYEAINPACNPYDVLTDRWPEDLHSQRIFTDELRAFAVDLQRLRSGLPLPEMRKTLEKLFGERSAADSVRKFMDRQVNEDRSGIAAHIPSTGKVAAVASIATPSYARPTPRTSPWGD